MKPRIIVSSFSSLNVISLQKCQVGTLHSKLKFVLIDFEIFSLGNTFGLIRIVLI